MTSLELLSFRRLLDRVVDHAKAHWRALLVPTVAPLVGFGIPREPGLFTVVGGDAEQPDGR